MRLPPAALAQLRSAKARLVYRMLHPDPEAELRELERERVRVIVPECWAEE